MKKTIPRRAGAAAVIALAVLTASPAFAKKHFEKKPAEAPAAPPSPLSPLSPAVANGLLPDQLSVDAFWPDLSMVQKLPALTPEGYEPVYTERDWETFQTEFGAEAARITSKRGSTQLAFCERLLKAADEAQEDGKAAGFRRLLRLRAAALAYRHKDGYPVADAAVAGLRKDLDLNQPTHVGALFSICSNMARQAVTPKPERAKYDDVAVRADLQLTLQLLARDQLSAAQSVCKLLMRHETAAVRADVDLKHHMSAVRRLLEERVAMMDTLGRQWTDYQGGDESAALPLYLYARFVRLQPDLMRDLVAARRSQAVTDLDRAVVAAEKDATACFATGQRLQAAAGALPPGMLRSRVLFAALQDYGLFLRSPLTDADRVHRTLSRLASQKVLADGAAREPVIRPFEVSAVRVAATGPAIVPATQAGGMVAGGAVVTTQGVGTLPAATQAGMAATGPATSRPSANAE